MHARLVMGMRPEFEEEGLCRRNGSILHAPGRSRLRTRWRVVQSCAWFGTRVCVLQPTLFKSGDDNSTLKVIIEIRENKSMRQFLNNDTLVAKCNGPEAQAAIKALNVG